MKCIEDFYTIIADSLAGTGTSKGLNQLSIELIREGYEPFGGIVIFQQRYYNNGGVILGGGITYYRDFVKYKTVQDRASVILGQLKK